MYSFPERLNLLINEKKVSKKDIANIVGISLMSLHRYFTGERKPTYDSLIALADYFDVSVDYLVGRTTNPSINYLERILYSDNPNLFTKLFSDYIQKIPSDAYTAMLELINALDRKSNIRYLETGQPDFSYYDNDWKPVFGTEVYAKLLDALFDNGIITLFFEDGSKHIFSFNEENIFLNTNMLSKIYYHDHKRNQDFRIIFE